jgi:HEAT repeat protein
MSERFSDMLRGGHPNSLARTPEVVDIVLDDPARLTELFASLADSDELVRMRAGDALEKVCREQPGWFGPHVERVLGEAGNIEQPSVQWHVAQMLQHLRDGLSEDQVRRATELLRRNLTRSADWIVLNVTMDVLGEWAEHDPALAEWLTRELQRLRGDARKSVAKRAAKHLSELTG